MDAIASSDETGELFDLAECMVSLLLPSVVLESEDDPFFMASLSVSNPPNS